MHDPQVLLATIVARFSAGDTGRQATPDDVASTLLERDEVSTVRIGAHDCPSVIRVDATGPASAETAKSVTDVIRSAAADLDLKVDVTYVGLARDADRVEVFREGMSGDVLSWGER